ncbi:hypothetical protein CCH79_00008588 [Gambusia affinis]|uniref:KHDC4/BBP-like KH-domain type I domain-containing protein n=1 Tax=Gambusia affinis TaxID=33528 RepID=A0A315UVW9_GAMAF|nr:hypothetical protein CCH79_00008588 [Gambusia affinis]
MTIQAETLLRGEGWWCPFTQERAGVIHQAWLLPVQHSQGPSCILLATPSLHPSADSLLTELVAIKGHVLLNANTLPSHHLGQLLIEPSNDCMRAVCATLARYWNEKGTTQGALCLNPRTLSLHCKQVLARYLAVERQAARVEGREAEREKGLRREEREGGLCPAAENAFPFKQGVTRKTDILEKTNVAGAEESVGTQIEKIQRDEGKEEEKFIDVVINKNMKLGQKVLIPVKQFPKGIRTCSMSVKGNEEGSDAYGQTCISSSRLGFQSSCGKRDRPWVFSALGVVIYPSAITLVLLSSAQLVLLTWLLRCDAGSSAVLLCSPSENKLFCLFEHFYPSASSPLEVSRLRCLRKQSQAQHPILSLSGGWDALMSFRWSLDEVLLINHPPREPNFNFVGKLLGPRGNSLKRLQEDTLTKMSILGKGSMRDKEKEEELRQSGEAKYHHLNEDLHVLIEVFAPPAEAYARMGHALEEIKKFLIPDYNDEIRQAQLQELTYLNGGSEDAKVPSVRGKSAARGRGTPVPGPPRSRGGVPPLHAAVPRGAAPRGSPPSRAPSSRGRGVQRARGAPPAAGYRAAPPIVQDTYGEYNVPVAFVAAVAMRPCTSPALSCEPVRNTNSLHCQDEFPGEAGNSAAHLADRRERGESMNCNF